MIRLRRKDAGDEDPQASINLEQPYSHRPNPY